jgi:hypothetical protein
MSDDLRTLAQAVVDADCSAVPAVQRAYEAATCDLGQALGYPRGADATTSTARAILAALDAAEAQGYARAMGEVVERCEDEADDAGYDALGDIADWARERLPAAAEKGHGG